MIYALRPYLACQYCTLSSEPLYIANTFSFHSGFHGFDAGSCKEKTDQNWRPLISVTMSRHFSTLGTWAANLTLLKLPKSSLTALYEMEWGLPRWANGSYSIVTRRYLASYRSAWDQSITWLLRSNLNSSARSDLTVLTYCFLSLGLMETSAWQSRYNITDKLNGQQKPEHPRLPRTWWQQCLKWGQESRTGIDVSAHHWTKRGNLSK